MEKTSYVPTFQFSTERARVHGWNASAGMSFSGVKTWLCIKGTLGCTLGRINGERGEKVIKNRSRSETCWLTRNSVGGRAHSRKAVPKVPKKLGIQCSRCSFATW